MKFFYYGKSRPLLFIFVPFNHNFNIVQIVDFSEIRTRIIWVEGENSDHLTTATAHLLWSYNVDQKFILRGGLLTNIGDIVK